MVWFLAAGLIYLLLFNLRYAIIDGRTYSLSSVASANDLIFYTASTAALALLIGWLVSAVVRQVFTWYVQEGLTVRQIVERLNDQQTP